MGGMLKDLNDIKLQLSATGVPQHNNNSSSSGASAHQIMKIENEIMSIKDKLDVLSQELEGGGPKGLRKAGLEDEV